MARVCVAQVFLGSRADLRFRPAVPAGLSRAIPRQKKERFDASRVSPLLQQYVVRGATTARAVCCCCCCCCGGGGGGGGGGRPPARPPAQCVNTAIAQRAAGVKMDVCVRA